MRKLIAALAFFAVQAAAQGAPALPPVRIVTGAWLADHLHDPNIVVIQLERDAKGASAIIQGARVIPYDEIVVTRDGLGSELPEADKLRSVFEAAGISDATLVVVTTSHQAPMAARGLMSLDYLGHTALAMLDGGVAQWSAEMRPTSKEPAQAARGHITTRVRTDLVVDAPWISERLGKPGLALIDTRSDGEYVGSGDRHGMPSAGHLAGARQLQWEQLFKDPDTMQFKSRDELAKLYGERMKPGDTVVTYCWVGYRASMTYTAARILGLPVRLYDGSYQDWQKRNLPVTAGEKP